MSNDHEGCDVRMALALRHYLNNKAAEIRAINVANGWNVTQPTDWDKEYKVLALLALVHSEVSEAVEALRKDDKANFVEEMADVVIRVLDCIGGLDVDFDKVVADKLEKNKARGYKHGGKRV